MKTQSREDFQNKLKEYLPSTEHPSYVSWKNYHLNAVKRGFEIVELLVSNGLLLRGRRVLDVGCGTCGPYVALTYSGAEVVGLDLFIDSLKVGKERIASEGFEANLIVASAQHLPFRNNRFDVVLFSDVIEHTQKPSDCAKEISYILNDGGLLYGTGPNIFSIINFLHDPHYRLPFISILPPSVGKKIEQKTGRGGEEIKMFTLWGIVKLFRNHGFRVFIMDDIQTRKKFMTPSLVQSKIRRLLLSITKRTRTDEVILWLMRIFYNSVYRFLCVKKCAVMKDIDSQNVAE